MGDRLRHAGSMLVAAVVILVLGALAPLLALGPAVVALVLAVVGPVGRRGYAPSDPPADPVPPGQRPRPTLPPGDIIREGSDVRVPHITPGSHDVQ